LVVQSCGSASMLSQSATKNAKDGFDRGFPAQTSPARPRAQKTRNGLCLTLSA
jgi:hypothetical protein